MAHSQRFLWREPARSLDLMSGADIAIIPIESVAAIRHSTQLKFKLLIQQYEQQWQWSSSKFIERGCKKQCKRFQPWSNKPLDCHVFMLQTVRAQASGPCIACCRSAGRVRGDLHCRIPGCRFLTLFKETSCSNHPRMESCYHLPPYMTLMYVAQLDVWSSL